MREAYEQDRYERARQLSWRTGNMVRAIQEDALRTAGWFPMREAPKDTTRVMVLMRDGTIHKNAHWTSNVWSTPDNNDPIAWRPKEVILMPAADSSGNAPGKHFGPD